MLEVCGVNCFDGIVMMHSCSKWLYDDGKQGEREWVSLPCAPERCELFNVILIVVAMALEKV